MAAAPSPYKVHFKASPVTKTAACKLCAARDPPLVVDVATPNSSTTGMKSHLRTAHKEIFMEVEMQLLENENKELKANMQQSKLFNSAPRPRMSADDKEKAARLAAMCVAGDLRPASFCERTTWLSQLLDHVSGRTLNLSFYHRGPVFWRSAFHVAKRCGQ
jgi:hypothetical protein